METVIQNFEGIRARSDPTDSNKGLFLGRGVYLQPEGMISRPPVFDRLWQMPNLKNLMATLALDADDKTVLIKIVNEGYVFLAFYDCANEQGLSWFQAGIDIEDPPTGPPTFTADDDLVMQVLWRGLAEQAPWGGDLFNGGLVMGNGADDNLIFYPALNIIGKFGDHIRPPKPSANLIYPQNIDSVQATLEHEGLIFTAAIEAQGEQGNYVTVEVVQGNGSAFSSRLKVVNQDQSVKDIVSTTSENRIYWEIKKLVYTVICPNSLPTNAELAAFIQQDPNAFQAVTCVALSPDDEVALFTNGKLSGGIAPVNGGSAWFVSSNVTRWEVYLSYGRSQAAGGAIQCAFSEPTFVDVYENDGYQIEVSIPEDENPRADDYDTIYVFLREARRTSQPLAPQLQIVRAVSATGQKTVVLTPEMVASNAPFVIEFTNTQIPPPCKYFQTFGGKLVCSGNVELPARVWTGSLNRVSSSNLPQNVLTFNYSDIPADGGQGIVKGLSIQSNQTLVWSDRNVYLLSEESVSDTAFLVLKKSALPTGLLNQRCLLNYEGQQLFIGRDFNIYSAYIDPTDNSASQVPKASIVNGELSDYLRKFCDLSDDLFTHTAYDFTNQDWWIWCRGQVGYMQTFVFNVPSKQLSGPIDLPGFVDVKQINESDGRMVGITPAGNILWLDLRNKLNQLGYFDNNAAVTLFDKDDPAPVDIANDDGFGWACMGEQYIRKAQVIQAASGFLRLGSPRARRTMFSVDFTAVRGSAGHVCFKLRNEKGQEIRRPFGEVFGKEHHRRKCLLSGEDFQWELLALVGDDKPFSIRDITVTHNNAGDLP